MTKDIKKLKEEIELLELQKRILELKQDIRSLEDNVWESVYPYNDGTITVPNPMPDSTINVPYWCGGNTYTN